jgi:hypothetical protein
LSRATLRAAGETLRSAAPMRAPMRESAVEAIIGLRAAPR